MVSVVTGVNPKWRCALEVDFVTPTCTTAPASVALNFAFRRIPLGDWLSTGPIT